MHPTHPYTPAESSIPAQTPPGGRPILPPLPPRLPPYVPMGGGQYHVPGAPMYAPWMHAQPHGVPLHPYFYPPAPHVQQVPGVHAGVAPLQWDYMRHPTLAPVPAPPHGPIIEPQVLATQDHNNQSTPTNEVRTGDADGHVGVSPVGARTAAASTGATQARKKYPNKQIAENGEYLPLMTTPDTDVKQCGSSTWRSPMTR
jgi:hypothetical protein